VTLKLPGVALALFVGVWGAGIGRASAQEPQPQTTTAPPDQPAPQAATEETSPGRKWPPFGIGIGPGVLGLVPTGDSTNPQASLTVVGRFIRSRRRPAGLVPALRFSLGGQKTELITSNAVAYGSVHVRPLMGGVGWSQPIADRVSTVFSVVVGYSWNGLDLSDLKTSGRPRLTEPGAVVSVGNSFATELSSRLWFDVTNRVSLMAGLSFLHTRPELTLNDGTTRPWSADQLRLQTGIAFTILKPRH